MGSSGSPASGASSGGTGGVPSGSSGSSTGGSNTGGSNTAGSNTGGSTSDAVTLDQTGNPVHQILKTYSGWLSTEADAAARLEADRALADNIVSWQMPHGGFFKRDKAFYGAAWNGTAARSDWRGANDVEIGTIDNDGTVTEFLFLADVFGRSGVAEYRDSARKALDFLLTMQTPTGGFPQVYPARSGSTYSNQVTFNDDAMVRVLLVLDRATKLEVPFQGDVFTAEQRERAATAVASGVDYILKAQIAQNGEKTVWCAQHDPASYAPRGARSYEHPSKSGKESAGVVGFLMTQQQTPAVKAAVQAALAWYASDAVKVADTAYVSRPSGNTDDSYNPIQPRPGSTLWYRFYDVDMDVGFFSGRLPSDDPPGVGKKYDIMEIEAERRYGYEWGGSYGTKLLAYAASVGY